MRKVLFGIIILVLCSFLLSQNASAHAYSAAFTKVTINENQIELTFSIDTLSVEEAIMEEDKRPLNEAMSDYKTDIQQWVEKNLILSYNQVEINSEYIGMKIEQIQDKEMLSISYLLTTAETGATFAITDNFYKGVKDSRYVNFLSVQQNNQSTQIALEGNNREWLTILTENQEEQQEQTNVTDNANVEEKGKINQVSPFSSFFKLGIHHILTGYDHLLFLLALLLLPQSIKKIAIIVTAFTIGHSITLALGVMDWIDIPSKLVESLIALSICYVAIENIIKKEVKYRWLVTLLFGLIHGLGFSSLIKGTLASKKEFVIELLAFNLGIEFIQILLVVITVPLLLFLYRKSNETNIVKYSSLVISALGAFWFVQRIFS